VSADGTEESVAGRLQELVEGEVARERGELRLLWQEDH
jgi:hypothetical protein